MQSLWSEAVLGSRPTKSAPCSPLKPAAATPTEAFHVALKVPVGDTPYVRAKRVQLVDKDPEKAIALFWAAINAGDRVDSALKDMAIVMKQQNRAEEAIEAIKSLRSRCSDQAQESLDNILLDLFKVFLFFFSLFSSFSRSFLPRLPTGSAWNFLFQKCGRLEEQIALLRHKLRLIEQGMAFNGRRTKTARSQGRKFQVSLEEEATRLLGNLGWALMQKESFKEAEAAYRRALMIGPDSNKMCNLGICLMKQGRIAEAKETLQRVKPAMADGPRGVDSHLKAFERAQEMLRGLETGFFPASTDPFWNENSDPNPNPRPSKKALSAAPPPFYPKVMMMAAQDPMGNLKRTRSGGVAENLPDEDAFDEAIVAAVLAPVLEAAAAAVGEGDAAAAPLLLGRKVGKRLRVFQDITTQCLSPKA
ncbi:protein POLLENLESS 3-LIKE 2-like isoform X1 [Wolffia australiana]